MYGMQWKEQDLHEDVERTLRDLRDRKPEYVRRDYVHDDANWFKDRRKDRKESDLRDRMGDYI